MDDDNTMVSLTAYATMQGKSLRTVQRWLADGQLPEAYRDDDSRWWVPAKARRHMTSSLPSRSDRVAAGIVAQREALPAPPLGVSGTLEDAATSLGVSVRGLRRLYADIREEPGLPMYIGPYGPHGALRVVVPPK